MVCYVLQATFYEKEEAREVQKQEFTEQAKTYNCLKLKKFRKRLTSR